MSDKITQILYDGEVEVTFSPGSHRYEVTDLKAGLDKARLPSVTAATGIVDKSRQLIFWAFGLAAAHWAAYVAERDDVLDKAEASKIVEEALRRHQEIKAEAASIGSLVHAWAEAYAAAKAGTAAMPPIPEDMDPRILAGINGFLDWVNTHKVKFVATEQIVYSRAHGYVGIFDAVAMVDDVLTLLDYKTAKACYGEYHYQIAAYALAYGEMTGIENPAKTMSLILVRFDKETGAFEVVDTTKNYEKDKATFFACLTVKKRETELAKIQPTV